MPALRTRDRALTVTTNELQPPTLAIISPTPRAFTFPISHNLADSPYSSPSSSPFDPDRTTLPPRTLTPELAPQPPSHRRRKSTSAAADSPNDRRPKKGDDDYIKRPENAFILFRRKCCEDRQAAQDDASPSDDPSDPSSSSSSASPAKKQRQADLSKTISQQWKCLSPEDRQYWEQLAKEKKKEHEAMYPNYVYRPQRAKDKDARSKSRKPAARIARPIDEQESTATSASDDSLSFVVPMPHSTLVPGAPRHHPHAHGRSASAPTPPPYQNIQIPNVYQMTPSCPSSPSLLPMISRRATHPGHADENAFDFHPNSTYPGFEASLQSSEFLRHMFSIPPFSQNTLLPAPTIHSASSASSPSSTSPSSPASPFDATNPFPTFSWSAPQPHTWSSASALGADDFDLGSIPPLHLGVPIHNEKGDDLSLGAEFGMLGLGMGLDGMGMDALNMEMEMDAMGMNGQGGDSGAYPQYPTHADEFGGMGFDEMMAGGHGF
ncbi:hypothetical protein BD779DRAFT_1477413 [Infundibulicybe gibba]|nr:hypothetical protein BD779DRAFT_1477413 [Infundibulicybe gibba]